MQGKRRRQPSPPTAAGQLPESPEIPAANEPAVGGAGVHYDADELFLDLPRLSVREQETLELFSAPVVLLSLLLTREHAVGDEVPGV
jgi:hypothetical protein